MTSTDEVLLRGLAADLHQQGFGVWAPLASYPDDVYPDDVRGIILEDLPETPNEVISVALTNQSTTAATYRRDEESGVWFVQIRLRTVLARDGRELQAAMRDRYHRRRLTLTGPEGEKLTVTGAHTNRAPLGPDANRRRLFTQNFTFTGRLARSE